MTRINLVPPSELSRLHLVAEYRELPRVFSLVRAAQERGLRPSDIKAPTEYVLGPGHVKFFYSRCAFLLCRQRDLVAEMLERGYDPAHRDPSSLAHGIEDHWLGDYSPTPRAIALNRARITERS